MWAGGKRGRDAKWPLGRHDGEVTTCRVQARGAWDALEEPLGGRGQDPRCGVGVGGEMVCAGRCLTTGTQVGKALIGNTG